MMSKLPYAPPERERPEPDHAEFGDPKGDPGGVRGPGELRCHLHELAHVHAVVLLDLALEKKRGKHKDGEKRRQRRAGEKKKKEKETRATAAPQIARGS